MRNYQIEHFSADHALLFRKRPKPKSNGNCSLQEIRRLINKDGLVEVNDYANLEKYKILSKKFKYLKEDSLF